MPALTAGISVPRTEVGIAEVLYEGQEQIAVAVLGDTKTTSGSRNSSSTCMSCKGGVMCSVCNKALHAPEMFPFLVVTSGFCQYSLH